MSNTSSNWQSKDDNDSNFTDTYPEDWPDGKHKFKPCTKQQTRFKWDEGYKKYMKQRHNPIKAKHKKEGDKRGNEDSRQRVNESCHQKIERS